MVIVMDRDFRGIWIPAEIWLTKELTVGEKLMYVEIESLSKLQRGCFASNAHFAEMFSISNSRVSEIISSLAVKGFVSVEQKRQGVRTVQRIIQIIPRHLTSSENTKNPFGKGDEGSSEKAQGKNTKIFTNTKKKNIAVFDPSQGRPENVSPDVWEGFCKMRKQKRALLTERACELIARKLVGLSKEAADGVVDQSTASSWSDVYPEKAVKQAAPAGNGKRPRPTNLPDHKFPHPEWDNGVYEICTVGRHNPETGYLLPGQY